MDGFEHHPLPVGVRVLENIPKKLRTLLLPTHGTEHMKLDLLGRLRRQRETEELVVDVAKDPLLRLRAVQQEFDVRGIDLIPTELREVLQDESTMFIGPRHLRDGDGRKDGADGRSTRSRFGCAGHD